MPVINILPPHVADMIAAGEVVERPASVVKELMENAFDAGAKNVTVELRGGGATYIRVTDDGCGMAPEDAGVAFLRHATSKLKDERGLEAIGTMGFRGEALAAISAVSHVELRTRRHGDGEGTFMSLAGGEIQEMGPTGCPEGTSMTIRDLFYNTPARLKFLKSDRSEAAACVQTALRCALGRPEVSVRLLRDEKEEFFSPGDGRQDSCVYTLLGREQAASLLRCQSRDEKGLKLSGFVSSPAAGKGSRAGQYFFCNGRTIKSVLLQTAVEQAYKNTLLAGRYPACVLYLDIPLGSVDVNVHPAKTEVKFSDERRVFDLVCQAAKFALETEKRTAQVELSPSTRKAAQPKADFYRSMRAEEFRRAGTAAGAAAKAAAAVLQETPKRAESALRNPESFYQTRLELPRARAPAFSEPEPAPSTPPAAGVVEKPVQNVESPAGSDHKIVGEALKTYIIVERGEDLLLIDKHAAHERMIFDRLKSREGPAMSQSLLAPVLLKLTPEEGALLEANAGLLEELGFEIGPFGWQDYAVRAVPADMAPSEAAAAVEEILEKLRRGAVLDPASARDEILRTVACKAAIKAGWDTQGPELEKLVEMVLSGQIKYCPHGRPVAVTLTKRELDKQFKRIV